MMLTKLKTMTAVLLLGMITFGGGLLARYTAAAQQTEAAEQSGEKAAPAESRKQTFRLEVVPATEVRRYSVASQEDKAKSPQEPEEHKVKETKTSGSEPHQEQEVLGYVEARGQLVRNAKTDELQVELKIRQEDVGRVLAAFNAAGKQADLDVDILLTNRPTRTYKGKLAVDRIQARPMAPTVPAWVRMFGSDIPKNTQLTPDVAAGTEVVARIRCGKQSREPATSIRIGDVSYTLPFTLPSAEEILRALPGQSRPNNARIHCELIVYSLDAPKVYPLVGPARLGHAHFKCTVLTDAGREVVYIDRDHLIPEQ